MLYVAINFLDKWEHFLPRVFLGIGLYSQDTQLFCIILGAGTDIFKSCTTLNWSLLQYKGLIHVKTFLIIYQFIKFNQQSKQVIYLLCIRDFVQQLTDKMVFFKTLFTKRELFSSSPLLFIYSTEFIDIRG